MGQEPGASTVDPKRDPVAYVYENRDALTRMPEEKALKFADRLFQKYMLPKYMRVNKQGLTQQEIQGLRVGFIARLFDIPAEKTEISGEKPEKPGAVKKGAAALAGGGAGVLGGIRTMGELIEKLNPKGGHSSDLDKISKIEGRAYEEAKSISPGIASGSAAVGHQIPAMIVAEGAGGALPKLAAGAPTALRAASGGARGAVEGAAYTGAQGGDAKSGAIWGGVLGAAFPLMGGLFGLGKSPVAKATAAVTQQVSPKVTGEVASAVSTAPKSMGDLAEQLAQKHYQKPFKSLSPAERAELPKHMKAEVQAQATAKAAEKKAKADAIKEAKKLAGEEERAAKAKTATETATKQAETRAAGQTPIAKEAVAATAAKENPAAAKIMGAASEAKSVPEVTKVPEGQHGTGKVARQAKERERAATERATGKRAKTSTGGELTGGGIADEIMKKVVEQKAKYTPQAIGTIPIPELEEAVKELGGEEIVKSFQALRKSKKVSDVMYGEHLKEWALQQLEKGTP